MIDKTVFELYISCGDSMKVIIDRFEGDIAVLECNGEMLNAPAKLFENAKEGDHIEISVIKKKDFGEETEKKSQLVKTDDFSKETDCKTEEDSRSIFERLRKKSNKAKRD